MNHALFRVTRKAIEIPKGTIVLGRGIDRSCGEPGIRVNGPGCPTVYLTHLEPVNEEAVEMAEKARAAR